MDNQFINLNETNIDQEHLCCIIRSRVAHPGVEAKREWLKNRLKEGHVFRKLDVKGTVFIEYAPVESAWVPILGDNYLYLYCLWVDGEFKGKGYGKALLEYCIQDAKEKKKSGICLLGAKKQKHWLTNQNFVKSFGFDIVDSTPSGYELLALSFDGTKPTFTKNAKLERINNQELTIYYDDQCPFIEQKIMNVKTHCECNHIPITLHHIQSLKQAKDIPCVFNNYAVFYQGKFETVNLLELNMLDKIIAK
ncbi:N-acetyltransferase [Anaerorhabdus sp.]|uniref:N-acetyltransferase n=1 Tax=Anaerorhabdus sp. TaxID=1872524 RepID=UPI002FCB772A